MVSSSNQPHLLQATIIIRCANDAPHDAVANARQDHDERLTMQAEAIKQSLDRKWSCFIKALRGQTMSSYGQSANGRKRPVAARSIDPSDCVDAPTNTDVVLGQGSAQSWRPGNVRFHDLLDDFTPRYQNAGSKKAKRRIIQEIYDHVSASGRFLEKVGATDRYVEIDEDDAKVKIGYGIRYRKKRMIKAEAELAKQIKEQESLNQSEPPNHEHSESHPVDSGTQSVDVFALLRQLPPPPRVMPSLPQVQLQVPQQPDPNVRRSPPEIALFSDEDLESVLDYDKKPPPPNP